MKTFYIHIGPHKTGTTTIQNFLLTNKDALLDLGIVYPKAGLIFEGQHNIVKDIKSDATTQPMFGGVVALKDELAPFDKDVIISSEIFDSIMSTKPLLKLFDAFKAHYHFKVIMVYRTQLPLISSYWSTNISLMMSRKSLAEHIEGRLNKLNFLNYKPFIESYIEVFGKENLIIIPFSKKKGKDYLVNRILEILNVSIDLPKYKSKNISPSFLTIELLRETPFKYRNILSTRIVMDLSEEFLKKSGIENKSGNYISSEVRDKVEAHFAKDNQFLEDTFGDHLKEVDAEFVKEEYQDFKTILTEERVSEFLKIIEGECDSTLHVKQILYKHLCFIVKSLFKEKDYEKTKVFLNTEIGKGHLEYYFFMNIIQNHLNDDTLVLDCKKILLNDVNLQKLNYLVQFENAYPLLKELSLLGVEVRRNNNMGKSFQFFKRLLFLELGKGIVSRLTVAQTLLSLNGTRKYLELGIAEGAYFLQMEAETKIGVEANSLLPFPDMLLKNTVFYNESFADFFNRNMDTVLNKKVAVTNINNQKTYAEMLPLLKNGIETIDKDGFLIFSDCWNGQTDLFKAVLWLRSFRKDLNSFVLKADGGICIVSKKAAENPLDLTLEEIDNFTHKMIAEAPEKWIQLKPKTFFKEWFERISKSANT